MVHRLSTQPLFFVEVGELLAEMIHLGRVVYGDVWVVGMKGRVILVIGFGRVERFQRNNLGNDRQRKRFCLIELRDVGLGDVLLFGIGVENHGTILRAAIRALTIELRGIESDGEKYFEKLAVGNLRRVEGDLHGFGVTGLAAAHLFVVRRRDRASGIAGSGILAAF